MSRLTGASSSGQPGGAYVHLSSERNAHRPLPELSNMAGEVSTDICSDSS